MVELDLDNRRLSDALFDATQARDQADAARAEAEAALAEAQGKAEWTIASAAASEILRRAGQNIEIPTHPQLHHAANLALAEEWDQMSRTSAWMNLEDNLRQLHQQMIESVFSGSLSVDQAEPAKGVIETILGLPTFAKQVGNESRRTLEAPLPGEGLGSTEMEMP